MKDKRFLERLPLAADKPWLGQFAAIAVIALALCIRLAASPVMPTGYPYVSFFPAIILTAFLFGWRAGTLAAVLGALAAWYFLIPPLRTFKFDPQVGFALCFYAFVAIVDIVLVEWLQRTNRRLILERERNAALAQRSEILFRELQHRVSNNLQVVSGLLTLQRREVDDETARAALDEAARRLGLIGRIQRQLHEPSGEQLSLPAYLRQIAGDLIDAGGKPGIICTVESDSGVALPPDAAIPVALIIAEAIANALEHGFADRDTGTIAIHVRREQDYIDLTVVDDGHGLPEDFDLAESRSMGLGLARMLAKQLEATFTLSNETGAAARLRLPVEA
ncbi:sensor histidine kinase [Sphingomonas crocodyli]|uniref:histidine kinase n=1 Tax=Sphingomonas crocodyli TaxID=1979270 RepID=A0A437LWR3_9SPHN|nr:histidine kinase dimerization/phosphoacceptor domain -containing protein [Sphingomonas crocodyli]RVT89835.1 DUF4118 domain-containing protein [Sphingomonas crocodyli]